MGLSNIFRPLYVACSVDRPAVDTTSDVSPKPFRTSSIRTLLSILRNFNSTRALRSLDIRMYSRHSEEERGWRYYVGHAGILDDLARERIVDIVDGSPDLLHLGFELEENDSRYDELWWTSEIVRRFPARMQSTISVRVDHCEYGVSRPCTGRVSRVLTGLSRHLRAPVAYKGRDCRFESRSRSADNWHRTTG